MKEKIIIFAIGLLVGAVLSTGVFFIYSKSKKCDMRKDPEMQMNNNGMPQGNPPERPNSNSNGQNNEQGMMPNQNNNGEPPEMPNNQQNNN